MSVMERGVRLCLHRKHARLGFSRSLPSILPNINNKEGTYSATMEPEDDYGKQRILVPLRRIH